MKYAIITGASKGLGSALAMRLLKEGVGVFSISRTENIEVKEFAQENQLFYSHFTCNLSRPESVEKTFNEIIEKVKISNPEELWVFNNAGVIEPIETVGKLDPDAVSVNIQVNILAPILITNLLLQRLGSTKLIIVNVTSGAAKRPIQGWSIYCSTKAGLNMFTQTAAIEQQGRNHVIIGFNPGIMDTDMQQTIRSSSKEAFQDINTFISYKEDGLLRSSGLVANSLVDFLLTSKVESGTIYDINQLV